MVPDYWQDAISYISRKDEVMAGLIALYPDAALINLGNPCQTLVRAVVGQQISVKAADTIWQRLERQVEKILPEQLLAVGEENLRQCGLSRQKISYIIAIASAFEAGMLTPNTWQQMSDKEVINQLVAIRGIGKWTAEMFLIFHLNRPNVLPLSDLGLLNAIRVHYGSLNKLEIITRSQLWQPYRTVATWYLWRSLDPVAIQY
jgi:DNA-3-methyladenine glycosylase II